MSQTRVRLNNLSTQKVSGRSLRLSRLSRKRFPFPSAAVAAAAAVYIEDVFNTYLYTGTGYSRNINTGMKLGTGFASTTNLGNLGRFNAVDFAKSGNNVYAIGNDAGVGTALFYYSSDGGASWIQHTITGSGTVLEGCAFFAGKVFVAANGGLFSGTIGVNSYGVAAYSGNQATGRIRIVNNKLFVAFYNGGTPALAYTDDGINFVSAKGYDANIAIKDITYGDGYYFIYAGVSADGATGRIYRSTDLSNWTQVYSLNFGSGNAYAPRIAYANGKLVMTGGNSTYANKVFYSTDYGSSFTTVDITGLGPDANKIDYDGTKFFLGSYGYAYSADGVSWTGTDLYVNKFVVHSNGQYFIAHGENFPIGFVPILTSDTTVTTGNGGLVWIKGRSGTTGHYLTDTARGRTQALTTVNTSAQVAHTGGVAGFNADGFRIGQDAATAGGFNNSSATYVGWTFLKKPKFFDVVTYTGNGANRTIAHNLGSVPGCIIVKSFSGAPNGSWWVYHRSLTNADYLVLNTVAAAASGSLWNSTTPTDTVFSIGATSDINSSGQTYVAYLFAHDAGGFGLTGTDNVISCGSYTGDGTSDGTKAISLGYEPQWVLLRNSGNSGGDWNLFDNFRGVTVGGNAVDALLAGNNTLAEDNTINRIRFTSTGFALDAGGSSFNASGQLYVYVAIRRGPMRTPTSGTSVFYPASQTVTAGSTIDPGFPVDMTFCSYVTAYNTNYMGLIQDRLRGYATDNTSGFYAMMSTTTTGGELAFNPSNPAIYGINNAQTNIYFGTNAATGKTQVYAFRRAPGFFDVVCYTGNGATNSAKPHNLGVEPELIIVKQRNTTNQWPVYCKYIDATAPWNYTLGYLNTNGEKNTNNGLFGNQLPTSTNFFTAGNNSLVNSNAATYVAYLFATCPGVSKVGSYTGTGTTLQVNCGFTSGARFVMIKRFDTTGDWYVWDTARGIVAGNDPYLLINSTAAEVTNTDYIDTYSPGFELSSTAPAALNANGGTYIFLAIA